MGQPLVPQPNSVAAYEQEIEDAGRFFDKYVSFNGGFWQVITYPSNYEEERLLTPTDVGTAIETAKVALRGWDFPHIDRHGNTSNFNKGKQSFTNWNRYIEGWRAYQSGLFIWKRYFWEDIEGHQDNNQPLLSLVGVIYSLTEIMTFIKRLYGEVWNVDSIHYEIWLTNCFNRKLAGFDPFMPLWDPISSVDRKLAGFDPFMPLGDHISKENEIIVKKDIQSVYLVASHLEVAKDVIKKIFMMFNWDDPQDSMIEGWQKKLIERRGL